MRDEGATPSPSGEGAPAPKAKPLDPAALHERIRKRYPKTLAALAK